MSPSVEGLEKTIGRRLTPGDVLKSRRENGGGLHEVVKNNIKSSKTYTKEDGLGIKTVELTQSGPTTLTMMSSKKEDLWINIVKEEDRIDLE